jgi:hypothetical protein
MAYAGFLNLSGARSQTPMPPAAAPSENENVFSGQLPMPQAAPRIMKIHLLCLSPSRYTILLSKANS